MAPRQSTLKSLPWAFVYTLIDRAALALLMVGLAPVIGVHETGLASLSMAIVFLALPIPQGMSDAIVQLPRDSERGFGLLAIASTTLGLTLAVLLGALAPTFGYWFGDAELSPLLQVHGLVILASGVSAVPDGMLARKLEFRVQAQRKLAGTIIGLVAAVTIAYVWRSALSVVAFHVISQIISAAIALFTVRHSLSLRAGRLGSADLRRIAGSVLSQFLGQLNLRSLDLIVGAALTIAAVGLWRMGYNMMLLVTAVTLAPVASLLLPAFAEEVRSGKSIAGRFLEFHRYAAAIAIPAFIATAAGMPFLFSDFFPPEWAAATLAGQIACLSGFANTISTLGLPSLLAAGHYRDLLTANVLSVVASISLTLCLVPFGINAVAISLLLKSLLVSCYVAYALRRRSGVSSWALVNNFLVPTAAGGLAALLGYLVATLVPSGQLSVVVFGISFIAAWVGVMMLLFRRVSLQVIAGVMTAVASKR